LLVYGSYKILKMNKKRLIDLSAADLLENQIWEYCMADNVEYALASDKTEVTEESNVSHIVVTDFTFNNRTKHLGFCTPPGHAGLENIQPVVCSKNGQVEFYRENDWTADDQHKELLKLGLEWKDVFPLVYTTRIKCGRKLHSGTIMNFNEGE
jgi:hypothetical protein